MASNPQNPWLKYAVPGAQADSTSRWAKYAVPVQRDDEGIDLSGLARTAAQGVTLGFSDELEGLAAGILPGGRTREEARAAAREDVGQFREAHPGLAFGAELAGAAIPSLIPLPGARVAALGRLGKGATTVLRSPVGRAAVESAIAGAGTAEGTLRERLPEAAIGGTVGTVLGAAGQRIARPIARLRGRARGEAGERLAETATQEGTDLTALAERMRPGQLLPEVAEPGGPIQALTRQVTAGQEPGARRLRGAIQQRGARASQEAAELLERRTGLRTEDVFQTAEDLARAKKANAQPLYQRAGQFEVSDDVVRSAFSSPRFREVYQAAEEVALDETRTRELLEAAGQPVPVDLADAAPLPKLFEVADDGSVEFLTQSVPVRALDYMKKGLDAYIDRGFRGGTLDRRQATLLRKQLNTMLGRVDELVPEYKAARSQWAGDAAMEDAFSAPREGSERLDLKPFLREDPRKIARVLDDPKVTVGEKEFYRRGAQDLIMNMEPRKRARFLFSEDPGVQRKIRQVFANEAEFERFRTELTAPEAQFRLGRLAGRAGQAPSGGVGVAGPGTGERVRQFATGAAMAPVFSLGGRLRMIRALAPGAGISPAAASELGDLLASTTPETFEEMVRLIRQRNMIRAGLPATAAAGLTLEGGERF